MKRILFIFLFCFVNFVFSQNVQLQFKSLGEYEDKKSIYLVDNGEQKPYDLIVDFYLDSYKKTNFQGISIVINQGEHDIFFNQLMNARQQFKTMFSKVDKETSINQRVGRDLEVSINKWNSKYANVFSERTLNNEELVKSSFHIVNTDSGLVLRLTSNSSLLQNVKGVIFEFDSLKEINNLLKLLELGFVRHQLHTELRKENNK